MKGRPKRGADKAEKCLLKRFICLYVMFICLYAHLSICVCFMQNAAQTKPLKSRFWKSGRLGMPGRGSCEWVGTEQCQPGTAGPEGSSGSEGSGAGAGWEGNWEIPISQGQERWGKLPQAFPICSIVLQIHFPFTSQLCVIFGGFLVFWLVFCFGLVVWFFGVFFLYFQITLAIIF